MTTTATITETQNKPEPVFSRGDLVRIKDSLPNNFVAMVIRTAEPGDVRFHGVVVYPGGNMDLGAVHGNFLVDRFVRWNGTIELQSK